MAADSSKTFSSYDLYRIYIQLYSILSGSSIPSSVAGRSYVNISGRVTAVGIIYSVPVGKKLNITSLQCYSVFGTLGYATLRDGGDAGTVIITTPPTTAANTPSNLVPFSFNEPLQVSTNIYFKQDVGTLSQACFNITGFLETL